MARTLPIIGTLLAGGLLVGCGGGGGGSDGTVPPPTETAVSALAVDAIGSNTATINFTTTPASAATVSVWFGTDPDTAQPLLTVNSESQGDHSVTLDSLWSAAPWRVVVSAGSASVNTTFTTALPTWPDTCRSGDLVLRVDAAGSWSTYTDSDGSVVIEAAAGCGGIGGGARLSFDLGAGEWVVAASNESFSPSLDLSAYTHLWVPFRGTAGVPVAFEVKLRDASGALSLARLDGGAGLPVWRSWAVDLREFLPQVGALDLSAVTALEFAFSWPLAAGGPRSGVVQVGDLSAWHLAAERPDVAAFERVAQNAEAMQAIAADLLSRQRPHGFMPAWFELAPNWHLYANAMALIVFALEYERLVGSDEPAAADFLAAAYLLADRLVELQQLSARNGAWDDSFRELDGNLVLHAAGSRVMWVGSTAWAGIALIVARDLLPEGDRYDSAISAAAAFYRDEQDCRATAGLPAGSVTEGTEGNLSSHLFFAAAAARGLAPATGPDDLALFIAENLFDTEQRRFFCGVRVDFGTGFDRNSCFVGGSGAVVGADARSCLDVTANWGAEWLKRQGRADDALAGFGYSRLVFPTRGFADPGVRGLGDIAGPWTPTVEHGAGQWAASGGPDANFVLAEAEGKLCSGGRCQGAADDFTAGIGWNTVSNGIAPAAWMYLAWHGGFWSRL